MTLYINDCRSIQLDSSIERLVRLLKFDETFQCFEHNNSKKRNTYIKLIHIII